MPFKDKIKNATREVAVTTRLKLRHARQDKRLPLLLALEFVLVMVLVGAVVIYLNPTVNLPEPFLAPLELRIFIFILITAAVLYLYSLTSDYRRARHAYWQEEKTKHVKN